MNTDKQIQILNVQKKCYELFLLYTETIEKLSFEQNFDQIFPFVQKRSLIIEQLQNLPFQVNDLKNSSSAEIQKIINTISHVIDHIESLDQKIFSRLSQEKAMVREQLRLLQIKKPAFKQYLSPRKYSAYYIAEHI